MEHKPSGSLKDCFMTGPLKLLACCKDLVPEDGKSTREMDRGEEGDVDKSSSTVLAGGFLAAVQDS